MKKIGILGGGQLALMLFCVFERLKKIYPEFRKYELWFLDKPGCSISKVTKNVKFGDFKNYNDVYRFGKPMNFITFEIESINVDALFALEGMGKPVFPQPNVIHLIQDKGLQRQFYKDKNIPTADFTLYENNLDIITDVYQGLEYPFMVKLRKDGYDGKGVEKIRSENDLPKLFEAPSLVESFVPIKKELSVIVARSQDGHISWYEPVEMNFDTKANVLDTQIAPADISKQIAEEAVKLAIDVAEALQIVGLLAVELFVTEDDTLLVNEVAPRPHNSGHHTIETTNCSQFEQWIRMVVGLEHGDTTLLRESVLINILGSGEISGLAKWLNIEKILALSHVHVTNYLKDTCKPKRKMGHVVIKGPDGEVRRRKVKLVKEELRVVALIK